VKYTRPLSCLVYSTAAKLGPCVKIYSSAFEVPITSVRSMCRVNLHHTFRLHITTSSLFRRLNLLGIDSYYHNRLLRLAGHVAPMPMSRAPRQLLTSLVAHSRPVACLQMKWGRTLENALASKGISKEFKEWIAIAKDRPKWRQQTHSKPKPPDA